MELISLPSQIQQSRIDISENEYLLELIYPPEFTFNVLAATLQLTNKAQQMSDGFYFDGSKDVELGDGQRKLQMIFRRATTFIGKDEFKMIGIGRSEKVE